MEEVCEEFMKDAKKDESSGMISGIIDGSDRFELFIGRLKSIGISFCVRTSTDSARKNKQNEFAIKFDGSGCPYTIVKRIYYGCVYGQEYYKRGLTEDKQDHVYGKKHRIRSQNTKKLGCDAHLAVKQIHVFIDEAFRLHELKQNSQWMKQKISLKLKEQLRGDGTTAIMRYKVSISSRHNHPITDDKQVMVHPELVARIQELVSGGTTSVKNIKIHLRKKVKELFSGMTLPDQFDLSFYPTEEMIHNHVFLALFRHNSVRFDQDALEDAINNWKETEPSSKFHFRPYVALEDDFPDGNSLLFCYQATWQQNLMLTYGNNICLLDTMQKTTKYSLPLFFIVVKTTVRYVIVGTFVCHTKSSRCIAEALQVFVEWNPTWKPPFFLTDYSEEEINAITVVFPGCEVGISAFHREQAWTRWVQKSGNLQHGSTEELLRHFRTISHSETEEEFDSALETLYESDLWKLNGKVQTYFTSVWLPEKKRWVDCYAEKPLVIDTSSIDDEIENQNKILKDGYLRRVAAETSISLADMIKIVIDQYLVESYRVYCEENLESATEIEEYEELPQFLNNSPLPFIRHVIERYLAARVEYSASDVAIVSDNIVNVRSVLDSETGEHVLDYDTVSCTCADFRQYHCPCKHFCAAFLYAEGYGFDRLPEVYRNNPLVRLIEPTETGYDEEELPVTEESSSALAEAVTEADDSNVRTLESSSSAADVLDSSTVQGEDSKVGLVVGVVESCDEKEQVSEELENQEPNNENTVEKLQESIRDIARDVIKMSYSSTDLDLMERTRYFLLSGANLLRSGLKQRGGDDFAETILRKRPRLSLNFFSTNKKNK